MEEIEYKDTFSNDGVILSDLKDTKLSGQIFEVISFLYQI